MASNKSGTNKRQRATPSPKISVQKKTKTISEIPIMATLAESKSQAVIAQIRKDCPKWFAGFLDYIVLELEKLNINAEYKRKWEETQEKVNSLEKKLKVMDLKMIQLEKSLSYHTETMLKMGCVLNRKNTVFEKNL